MTDQVNITPPKGPVVLCILDGWGFDPTSKSSAITAAETPVYDRLMRTAPFATLNTSGLEVGLPEGQMGNSEVGHMNLGAGRVVLQDLPMIDAAIADGSITEKAALTDLVTKTRGTGGTVHLLGLLSPGGVHSHQDHIIAMAKHLRAQGLAVVIHAFLDGRDTPPKSAEGFLATVEAAIAPSGARIGTVSGRYYAMDRDKRWDRVELSYQALVDAKGEGAATANDALAQSYAAETTDEFVLPTVIGDYDGIKDGDAVMMMNFRADRAREILTTLVDPTFDGFERARLPKLCATAGLTEYSAALAEYVPSLFPPEDIPNVMAAFLEANGKRQLHIAETEKYAHVTFFFNGGREDPYDGEVRILVPSPKVATYDLMPEMAAEEVTDNLVTAITKGGEDGPYDFIIVNYANPDMVGHTGVMSAAIKAAECIDECLGRLEAAVNEAGGAMLVTADHGNLEQMVDPDSQEPHTAHTTFVVPFILIGADNLGGPVKLSDGRLADVAPTLLTLMGLTPPAEMTGKVLIAPGEAKTALNYGAAGPGDKVAQNK